MLRWPSSADVLRAAALWAERQRCNHGDLLAVGVFGSYGRGDAGVGSDLDLVLILRECSAPLWERLRRWDTGSLPLACDLLVYSLEEWRGLPGWNPRLATALRNDTRWLAGQPPLAFIQEAAPSGQDDGSCASGETEPRHCRSPQQKSGESASLDSGQGRSCQPKAEKTQLLTSTLLC